MANTQKKGDKSALETLDGSQVTFSTQLIKPHYLVMPHRNSTTVSLESYPL